MTRRGSDLVAEMFVLTTRNSNLKNIKETHDLIFVLREFKVADAACIASGNIGVTAWLRL